MNPDHAHCKQIANYTRMATRRLVKTNSNEKTYQHIPVTVS
jgi:hypothetical protein